MRHRTPHAVMILALCVMALTVFTASASALTLNIEIDYMVLRDQNNNILHSHKPSAAEIAAVVQMFACHGHTLNIVVDDEIPHVSVIPQNPDNKKTIYGTSFTPNSFYLMKTTYFDNTGGGWHYCIFGHQYQINDATTGSSGLAERPGDDLVVTLGAWPNQIGSAFDRASTLAHEFGHNLGLTHCGSLNCSVVGPGPILMPSIMSYNFQLDGVKSNLLCLGLAPAAANLFKEMDYSSGRMCTLNETSLAEWFGTGMIPVDWDCNGVISGNASRSLDSVYRDDGWCSESAGSMVWADYNEWANISDPAAAYTKSQLERLDAETDPCITYEEVVYQREQKAARGACAQPTLTTEGCIGGQMVFMNTNAIAPWDGRCIDPYLNLTAAQPGIANNSVLYFRAGTYVETGSNFTISKPMLMTSVGNSVITTQSAPNLKDANDSTLVNEADRVVKDVDAAKKDVSNTPDVE